MPLLALHSVVFAQGTRHVLDGVTISIEPAERVGLVGRNGTGKSTLLRIITGEYTADTGRVDLQSGARVGMLSQDPTFAEGATVVSGAREAFAELHAVQDELSEAATAMGEASGAEQERLMQRYAELEKRLEHLGGYTVEHHVENTLHGLGFRDAQFEQPVASLSGGQRSRLALARLLLSRPDLILLDEPTNHLDIAGRQWLEQFLAEEFPGAVLIVSHDRYLLDRAVNRIAELEVDGTLSLYPGNYHAFRTQRSERKQVALRAWEKQQDAFKAEAKFIARYKAGQRAKQAAGREKRLERAKAESTLEKPIELDTMRLTLPPAPRSGDMVLDVVGLTKGFGTGEPLFEDVTFTVNRGDRLGIVGPNGTGKSTLIRCLLGEMEPDAGEVRRGSRVNVGYFSQMQEGLDLGLTVWQYLQSVILGLDGATKASEQQARDLAGAFLFSGDDQDKTLGMLSGGERSRAILAGLVAGGHNLLVLDEPTNHFDIPSAERLEQALSRHGGYAGTLVVVSHDRAFLDACVDRLLVLDPEHGARTFDGNYRAWVEHEARRLEAQAEARAGAAASAKPAGPAKPKGDTARSGGGGTSAPPARGAITKLSHQKLERLIEDKESRIREIDALFLDTSVLRDGARMHELGDERARLVEELAPLEYEWLRRAEEQADGG